MDAGGRLLFDLGVPVSVNSDDPLPFFTDIERELRLLVDEFQFAPVELYAITRYAAQAAFIGEAERQELLDTIAAAYLPGRELAG